MGYVSLPGEDDSVPLTQGMPHTCADVVTDHGCLSEISPYNWKNNPAPQNIQNTFLPRVNLLNHLISPFLLVSVMSTALQSHHVPAGHLKHQVHSRPRPASLGVGVDSREQLGQHPE